MQISLTPDPSLLAIMVIFFLNYLIVRRFFLQPVNEVLEARERDNKNADEAYEAALARLAEATAKMEAQLHSARRDAAQVRERFRSDAGAYRQQIVERTSGEARTMIGEADTSLAGDVTTAREQILRESDELARLAASRILGRPV